MNIRTSATRQKVAAGLSFGKSVLKDDVLDIDHGFDTFVVQVLLDAQRFGIPGLLITSGRRDRQNDEDKARGPHGHYYGKSCDLWCDDNERLANFLCAHPRVTVVGLGGITQIFAGQIKSYGKIFFDNSQDHLHFQVQ